MNITYTKPGITVAMLRELRDTFPGILGMNPPVSRYSKLNFDSSCDVNPELYSTSDDDSDAIQVDSWEEFKAMIASYFSKKASSPIIFDPYSPEAKALVGKKVYIGDTLIDVQKKVSRTLGTIKPELGHPFISTGGMGWIFIRAVEEEEAVEVTMEEVCAKFGKNVKIKKGE